LREGSDGSGGGADAERFAAALHEVRGDVAVEGWEGVGGAGGIPRVVHGTGDAEEAFDFKVVAGEVGVVDGPVCYQSARRGCSGIG